MRGKKCNKSNAGMTLVELLIAVTILAIIVVPFLHTFASSARTSLRAKRNLRVTTAAQDIMEGLKAETLESLSCSFNYPDDDIDIDPLVVPIPRVTNSFSNFHLVRSELVNGGVSSNLYEVRATVVEDETSADYRSVSGLTDISALTNPNMDKFGSDIPAEADLAASTKQALDQVNYEFYGKSDKKYYFAIQNMNIENDSVSDPVYIVDALIEVDGSNYTSSGSAPKTTAAYATETDSALLNEHGVIEYSSMDAKRDAFYVQENTLALKTAQEFNASYHPVIDCTEDNLSQQIIIRTEKMPGMAADGADRIMVTCTVTYTADLGVMEPGTSIPAYAIKEGHAEYDPAKAPQPFTKTYTFSIFDNISTGYALRNIYLCYYPGYGRHTNDKIVYVNPASVPCALNIVKQEPPHNGTLNHDEISYKCDVVMNEGSGADIDHNGTGSRADSVTILKTNLDTNLYSAYMNGVPNTKQATYLYNGATLNRDKNNPEATLIYELGGELVNKDLMYDVTIDIYEEGTLADAFSSGSIDNDRILFTLTGSMN